MAISSSRFSCWEDRLNISAIRSAPPLGCFWTTGTGVWVGCSSTGFCSGSSSSNRPPFLMTDGFHESGYETTGGFTSSSSSSNKDFFGGFGCSTCLVTCFGCSSSSSSNRDFLGGAVATGGEGFWACGFCCTFVSSSSSSNKLAFAFGLITILSSGSSLSESNNADFYGWFWGGDWGF